jgi:hypothetical protein
MSTHSPLYRSRISSFFILLTSLCGPSAEPGAF